MIEQRRRSGEPHGPHELFCIEFARWSTKDFVALGRNISKLTINRHYFPLPVLAFSESLSGGRSRFEVSPQNSRPRALSCPFVISAVIALCAPAGSRFLIASNTGLRRV